MGDDTKAGVPTQQKVNNALATGIEGILIALASYYLTPIGGIVVEKFLKSESVWGEGGFKQWLATPVEFVDPSYYPEGYMFF